MFTSSPGAGHLLPLLPVARAAAQAGHDVRVATGASMGRYLAAAGLRHFVVGPADIGSGRREFPEITRLPGRARGEAMWRLVFAGRFAEETAAGVLEIARDWRPDIVVREDVDLGSWIAAERLGIPYATIQAAAWRPKLRVLISEPLGRLRARHGLPPDPDLTGLDGSVFFTTRPPSLRDPAAPLPAGFAELRPEPDDDPDGAPPPDWLIAATTRRRVALTLGTENGDRIDVLRPIVDGLGRADVDVVVALGADPATLGAVPPNVRVERYVPLSMLLPRTDAVIFHGGSGTMLAALSAGVPVVVVPLAADQPDNADVCVAAGVGRALDPTELTEDLALSTVLDILDRPDYRRRAVAVAAEIAAMPGPVAAVRRLEALA